MTKVFEFGGGKVREHLGGIYDYLLSRQAGLSSPTSQSSPTSPSSLSSQTSPSSQARLSGQTDSSATASYAERKEQQKRQKRAEKAVEESEKKIAKMEQRLKELDSLLCDPKNASDMTLVTEYTDIKRQLDEEVERWETLSEEMEKLQNN